MHSRRLRLKLSGDNKRAAVVIATDDDILREILFRLPVTSLLVFQSVSKRWLSLISDPYFTCNHTLRNYPSISGIFLYRASFLNYPEYEFVPLKDSVRKTPFKSLSKIPDRLGVIIQQSCNGLLCCGSLRGSQNGRLYYIYNPSTMQYITLPQPRGITGLKKGSSCSICSVSLVFDPLWSPHYKVVCIWSTDDNYQIEIYSSESAFWRLSGDAFSAYDWQVFSRSGLFWNGALHWTHGESSYRFSVNTELLSTMPMPNIPNGFGKRDRKLEYFGASKHHLHRIEKYADKNNLYFLEMEIDYSSWNKKYKINLDELTNLYPEMVRNSLNINGRNRYAFSVLAVHEEEEELSLILHIPRKIISYNLKGKTFKKLKDLIPGVGELGPYLQYFSFDSFLYIETLARV